MTARVDTSYGMSRTVPASSFGGVDGSAQTRDSLTTENERTDHTDVTSAGGIGGAT